MNVIVATSALLVLAGGSDASGQACDAGYQTFLGDFGKLVRTVAAPEAAAALKKSLSVYDACKAGDAYAPVPAWRTIIEELEGGAKK